MESGQKRVDTMALFQLGLPGACNSLAQYQANTTSDINQASAISFLINVHLKYYRTSKK
jgi:hypothetical protein